MADIKPFKGVLYASESIDGDLSMVAAPPYDVISEDLREELYERDIHNVARLTLSKPEGNLDKYQKAGKEIETWLKDGVLARDPEDCIYIYEQEYGFKEKKYSRVGFISLMRINDDDILPHERTHDKPKEDRLNLMKKVKGNLSPIFTLFGDRRGKINGILRKKMNAGSPVLEFDYDGQKNRLWKLSGKEELGTIVSEMKDKKVVIADGHHRYEVAKTYRDMCAREGVSSPDAEYLMTFFTDLTDEDNLTVMGTHRVLKELPSDGEKDILNKLEDFFEVSEYEVFGEFLDGLGGGVNREHVFGFFGGDKFYLLIPRNKDGLAGLMGKNKSPQWKSLDVSALHSAVFDKILSVSNEEGNITYVRDPGEAVDLVKKGSHMAAFFLNPTRVDQLRSVAELGEMMPPKSTYFYPKLLTGLVINRFE